MNRFEAPTKSVEMVRKLFPSYKRRKVSFIVTTSVYFQDLNWSGGTRSKYDIVSLESGAAKSLAAWNQIAPWNNPHEGSRVELPPGFVVVKTGHFCGKESILTIYVHPSNVTPLLPSDATTD